jgi:hypothetical protein
MARKSLIQAFAKIRAHSVLLSSEDYSSPVTAVYRREPATQIDAEGDVAKLQAREDGIGAEREE